MDPDGPEGRVGGVRRGERGGTRPGGAPWLQPDSLDLAKENRTDTQEERLQAWGPGVQSRARRRWSDVSRLHARQEVTVTWGIVTIPH